MALVSPAPVGPIADGDSPRVRLNQATAVSVSIVTYNSRDEIPLALDSIVRYAATADIGVTVVDNNSSDGTADFVSANYPGVEVIRLSENLGYGGGHNVALRRAVSRYHLIVNPDIAFDADVLPKLSAFLDRNPDVVLAVPKVVGFDGEEQFLPRRIPRLRYVAGGLLESRGRIFKAWRDEYTRRADSLSDTTDIDFATGCFMFGRTSALQSVGGFDKRYFLYLEDADLTRELQRVGRTVLYPNVQVRHKWRRDNTRLGKGLLLAFGSMVKYMNKWGWRL